MQNSSQNPALPEAPRPWYREPWPWVLIALPAAAVVGCMISLWLALSHPDFLVVDEIEYSEIRSAIKAEPQGTVPQVTEPTEQRATAPPATTTRANAADRAARDTFDTTHAPGTDQR